MREKIGTNVKIGMSVTIDTQEKIDTRGRIATTDIHVIIIMIETLEILTGSGIEIMIDIEKVEMITTTMATEGIPHQGSGTSSDLQRGLFFSVDLLVTKVLDTREATSAEIMIVGFLSRPRKPRRRVTTHPSRQSPPHPPGPSSVMGISRTVAALRPRLPR